MREAQSHKTLCSLDAAAHATLWWGAYLPLEQHYGAPVRAMRGLRLGQVTNLENCGDRDSLMRVMQRTWALVRKLRLQRLLIAVAGVAVP